MTREYRVYQAVKQSRIEHQSHLERCNQSDGEPAMHFGELGYWPKLQNLPTLPDDEKKNA